MTTAKTHRKLPTGIRERHTRACASRDGACTCRPSYEAWVYLKREDRKVRRTFERLADAKAWRQDASVAARRNKLRGPSTLTLREASAAFLAGIRDDSIPNRSGDRYAPSSIRGYERCLRLRVLPELGDRKLTDITRSDVQDLADRMTGEGLSPSTVLNTLDPLRRIYDRAVKRDLVAIDPTDGLELRRPKGGRDRIAAPAEAARLLVALPDDLRALYATAMYAGLRRGELRALRWGDVDLAKRVIRVQRGWDDIEAERDDVKSDAGRRSVPILGVLAAELAAHGLRTTRAGDDLVFGREAHEAFDPSTVRLHALRAWEAFNVKARADAQERGEDVDSMQLLEPIGLHESRHCFASMLIASGANAKVIQSVMGHATIQMTFDRYGHLMPGGLDEAAAAANAYLARMAAPDKPGSQ
jgi:integrase